MARGSYLGKISAIVSVNTASVRPSLNTAAKDVDQWAKKADSSIRGAAQSYERALKGIFTPLQRLQAAIKTANSNPLSFQIQNAQAFTQLAKATEQIAKPLGQVQSQFAGLASSVQTELLPVLQSAQKQTTSLFNAISSGAKVSDRDLENTAARVERLNQVIRRAAEANQIARVGRTGNELAFAAPRVQDELSRSAQLSQRAADAPVALRADPGFRQRIQELDELRQRIVQYQAAVDRRQSLRLDTREAQAQLDSLIRRSADARLSLEQTTADANRAFSLLQGPRERRGLGLFGSSSGTADEQAIARAREVSAEFARLPEAAQSGLRGLAGIASNVANGVDAGTSNAQQLLAVLERLSQRIDNARDAARSFAIVEPTQSRRGLGLFGSSAGTADEQAIARAREVSAEFSRLPDAAQAGLRGLAGIASNVANGVDAGTSSAQQLLAVLERLSQRIGDAKSASRSFTLITPPQQRQSLGLFGAQTGTSEERAIERARAVSRAFASLPDSARAGLQGLAGIASRVADNVDAGLANAQQLNAVLDRLEERIQGTATTLPPGFFEDNLSRQNRAALGPALSDPQRQIESLQSSIGSVKGQLDQLPLSIRTHFLPAINAAEREFARLNALGPRATAEDIEIVTNQMRTLEAAASRAARASNFRRSFSGGSAENLNLNVQERSLAGYQAQLQLLQQTLGSVSTQARGPAVASFIALENAIATAFENGTLDSASTRRQLAALTQEAVRASAAVAGIRVGALTRQLARVGDVARGSFGNLGLAIQQGIFAFDDFFSVTGDLSQRIRAAGNNISQLGFILGGTYGLLAGVAISAGTQIAIGFGKFIGVLEDTKQREAEAKAQAEVLNSAYERQRAIVQSLADAYRDLAKGIRESTETPQNKAFNERRGRIADLRQQQQDAARERVAQAVPEIFNNRRQRALLEGQLQEQPDFAAQRRIRRQIGRLQAEEDAAFNAINENAGRLANQPRRELVRQRDELAVLRDNLVRDAGRLPAGGQAQQNVAARLDDVSTRLAAFNIAIQRVTDDAVAAAVEFSGPLQDNIQKAQQRLAEAFGDTQTRAQTQLEQLGRRLEEALNSASGGQEDRRAVRARIDAIRQEAAPILGAQQELVDFAEALKSAADAARRSEQQAQDRLQEATANAEDLPGSRAAQIQQRAAAQTAAEATRRRQEIEAQTQGGRNAAAVGDTEEIRRRRQNVGTLSGGLNRFQRDAERQQERLRRGFELTSGELGNFQEKLQSDILAIEERAKQDPLNAQKILQEGRAALARENAPLFAELAANVQNALLQGPSRAALNAADVTTMEGSRELNRLLRGDDPARDVNLLELQKQTASLASVDQGIKDLANKIGVAQ